MYTGNLYLLCGLMRYYIVKGYLCFQLYILRSNVLRWFYFVLLACVYTPVFLLCISNLCSSHFEHSSVFSTTLFPLFINMFSLYMNQSFIMACISSFCSSRSTTLGDCNTELLWIFSGGPWQANMVSQCHKLHVSNDNSEIIVSFYFLHLLKIIGTLIQRCKSTFSVL